ncbi:MAG: hypothetical protein IPM23_08855 [Candidatus Melainabacteria bacterium]|nr:hypothetical protein [Candidatus Melainabacteria bacterium]
MPELREKHGLQDKKAYRDYRQIKRSPADYFMAVLVFVFLAAVVINAVEVFETLGRLMH